MVYATVYVVRQNMADDAVKQRNFIIQDAYDFYIWEKQTQLASAATLFPSKKSKYVQICRENSQ